MHGKSPLLANASPPAQTPQGQPCLTGVGNNPLTITKPSQRAVSRMPKARRSRLSLTRCAGWATLPLCLSATSTLRKQQNDNRSKIPLPAKASPPAQTPQGQPCSTGVGNNPLTIPEHSQRAVSRMPKARRSRLSLTRCAGCAILPLYIFTLPITKQLPQHHCSYFPSLFIQNRPLIASHITISRTNLLCT